MVPHSNTGFGTRTFVNLLTGAVSTSSRPSSFDQLSGGTVVQGDHRAPNDFFYTTRYDTNYHGVATKVNHLGVSTERVSGVYDGYYKSVWERGVVPGDEISRLYNAALAKVYDKVRGSLDLSIAVAEMHQTKRLLSSIHKLETYVQKGSWWKGGLKTGGRNWLAYHLAWTPLIKDIYGSVDEFYRHGIPGVLKLRESATKKWDDQVRTDRWSSGDTVSMAQRQGKQGVRFQMQYKDKGGFDLNRWTSLNPVSIAWELMPYSFVVDYFYDIGGMLRSLESSLLLDSLFIEGYVTRVNMFDYRHRETTRINKVGNAYEQVDLESYSGTRYFLRTKLFSSPTPRPPTFVLPTSWKRLLTMASLLAVKLR